MHYSRTNKIKSFGKKNRLIIISNRGPFSFYKEGGDLKWKRSGGGLVSALLSLKDVEFTWIAAAQNDTEKEIGLAGFNSDNINIKFVDIPDNEYNAYYDKICNGIFWYTQHGLWDNVYSPAFDLNLYSDWQNYRKVNKRFAKAAACEINGNNTYIMVQDYHLYLVPFYIKKAAPEVFLNHFIHIPWPVASNFDVLPDFITRSVLESLLCSNIVAFHCPNYSMNFYSTVSRYLGLNGDYGKMRFFKDGNTTSIKHFPISVDSQELDYLAKTQEFNSYAKDLTAKSAEKIIVRVDRADLSKNIIRGFAAYEHMLKRRNDLIGKVTFHAMIYKTRTGLDDYKKYLKNIKETVDSINNKFGKTGWQPIQLRVADNYLQSLAALSVYDVLLVNPIADGMNLVAKEGPLVNQRDGVLVLSKYCGAHNELGGFCLSINPYDIAQTASAIEQALQVSRDKKAQRAKYLKSVIKHNNSKKWLYYNIKAMEELSCDKFPSPVS